MYPRLLARHRWLQNQKILVLRRLAVRWLVLFSSFLSCQKASTTSAAIRHDSSSCGERTVRSHQQTHQHRRRERSKMKKITRACSSSPSRTHRRTPTLVPSRNACPSSADIISTLRVSIQDQAGWRTGSISSSLSSRGGRRMETAVR